MPLALVLVLAAASPQKLAAPGFRASNLSAETARYCTERLAEELHQRGLPVTTERDIAALLGLERQKQLLGCSSESSSCMVELANALGVDGVVLGELAKLGSTIVVDVKVLSSDQGQRLASASQRVNSEDDLLQALATIADDLAKQLKPPEPASGRKVGAPLLAPVALGVVAGVTGGVLVGLAYTRHGQLTTRSGEPFSATFADGLAAQEGAYQTAGWVALGAAVAAIAVGIILHLVLP